jgi:hypothetical protein
MSFPIISGTDARRWISASRGHSDDGEQPEVQTQELGSDEDWDEVAGQIKDALAPLKAEAGEINRSRGAGRRFEAPAAIALHKAMPRHHQAYSDSGFWMWLAVTHFSDLIEWRYGNKEGGSDLKNYGIGAPIENLLYRLWLRAEIAYDDRLPEDPYHLVGLGDVDFWRSHVFRQSYSYARQFARALVKFQFPGGPDDKARLKIKQIRELAKRLSAARSNLLVEIMDPDRAFHFIEGEWSKLAKAEPGS